MSEVSSTRDTAFAKVILFGEHAVVHGRLAIAAALDRGATARAVVGDGPSTLTLAPWGRVATLASTGSSKGDEGEEDEVARGYRAILEAVGLEAVGVEACVGVQTSVDVQVPGAAGLGCSAAIGVSVVRAVARAVGRRLDDEAVRMGATAWERVFHGNPSGVDVAAATLGGVLAFRKGEPPKPIRFPEPLELAVAFTGEPSSTKAMVEQVARQLARRPQVVERTFDGIDQLAKKGQAALEAGRLYEVGRLMDLNHALLASLMVSSELLERACDVARKTGAEGAKLTGGGGGGCAIALAPGCGDAIVEAWRGIGLTGFVARIAATAPVILLSESAGSAQSSESSESEESSEATR